MNKTRMLGTDFFKKYAQGKLFFIFLVGFSFGLSTSFIDTLKSILEQQPFSPVATLFVSITTTTLAFFFIFLGIALVSHLVAKIIKGVGFYSLSITIAFFIMVFFSLGITHNALRFTTLSAGDFSRLLVFALISLLFSVLAFLLLKDYEKNETRKNRINTLIYLFPWLLLAVLVFTRFHMSIIEKTLSFFSLLLMVVFGLAMILLVIFVMRSKRKTPWQLLLLFLFIAAVLSPFLVSADNDNTIRQLSSPNKKKHAVRYVLLITIDTLRYDFLSCYRQQRAVTPHIDQLAEQGSLFLNAFAPSPWTLPSVVSVMTGVSPFVHHVTKVDSLDVGTLRVVPDNLDTLAEFFSRSGYITGATGQNPNLLRESNLSQGFDYYNFFPRSGNTSLGLKIVKRLFRESFMDSANSAELTRVAINWIKTNYKNDFFFWIHYLDPHLPYSPPKKYLPAARPVQSIGTQLTVQHCKEIRSGNFVPTLEERNWIEELYAAEVRYVDDCVGQLTDTLKKLNIYDETLIIVTSDHGEEFWEHDAFEHGHAIYNEILHVPLIMKLPQSTRQRIAQFVSIQGLFPTCLDLCKIKYNRNHLDIQSFSSLLANPGALSYREEPFISTALRYYGNKECIFFGNKKYILTLISGKEELYDLGSDEMERKNLYLMSPGFVQEAKRLLTEQHKRSKLIRKVLKLSDQDIKLSKDQEKKLKSLGYL